MVSLPALLREENLLMTDVMLFVALIVVLIIGIEAFDAWKGW